MHLRRIRATCPNSVGNGLRAVPLRSILVYEKVPDALASGSFSFWCDWVYKPGSVLTAIYLVAQLLTRSSRLLGTIGPIMRSSTALLRIEFTALQCSHGAGGLLHRLFTLTRRNERYLSVALVLRSPSAGVTRYPCPMKPGLSSPGAFQHPAAAVRPSCRCILLYFVSIVKHLAKCF